MSNDRCNDQERFKGPRRPMADAGKPLGTKEERHQMDEEDAGHPWSLLYKDFLSRVCSEYGFSLSETEIVDPWGRKVRSHYLKSNDGQSPSVHLPANLEPDTRLDATTTGSLCRRAGVPPEDFGLDPEEPSSEADWDLD
jgi:hypothetical protein